MRALELSSGRLRLRQDVPAPRPLAGEVRVRVRKAGICATDLALARGYMGFAGIPGHEFVGTALEGEHEGRRVVGEINAGCGRCARCAAGDPRHCEGRSVLGILARPGAFAEELRLPAANLHPVPDGVSDEAACFTEPLAAAFEVIEQVDLGGVAEALVIGDGRLGLLCAHALARSGLQVTVAGRHEERADLLPAGGRFERDLGEEGPVAGRRWPLVVEASGAVGVLPRAIALTAPRGTLVLKTTTGAALTFDPVPLVVDEIALVGSRCGPFGPALSALAEGTIPVEEMIHARFPLAQGVRAMELAARRGVLKVLLEMESEPAS